MAVYEANVKVTTLADQIKARRAMSKRFKTPNCTHLDMDRAYSRNQECAVCGLPPSIGFLYECRQDSMRDYPKTPVSRETVEKIESPKSDLRLQLEEIGFSESIILTAEGGHYTNKQLSKLKEMKMELRQIILDIQQSKDITDAAAKLTVIAQTPLSTDGTIQNSPAKKFANSKCTFKACHTCRPYFRDRLYISLQSVLSAEFAPVTFDDAKRLPIKSSKIMRTIGLTAHATTPLTLPTSTSLGTSFESPHTTATDSSEVTCKTSQTDMENTSSQHRPRKRFQIRRYHSSRGGESDLSRPLFLARHSFKSAVNGIFRSRQISNSNVALPQQRIGRIDSLTKSEPLLPRVRDEEADVDTSTGINASKGANDTSTTEPSLASESNLPIRSRASKGSEIQVDGGVALTEEAVETHTPDILAIEVPTPKTETVIQNLEVHEQEDASADIGLQNIMTQV